MSLISPRQSYANKPFRRYNGLVRLKFAHRCLLFLALFAGLLQPTAGVQAVQQPLGRRAQTGDVTAFDLIVAMNTLRMSNGLPALVEDPIINAVAQSTANIMAANQISSHIGDVSGRLASAGYGGGAKVWGTENFAVGNMSIDEIMLVWADAAHMIPALNPAYCNVGAGVAKSSNGLTYYVLQAAYTSNKACGEYKSPEGFTHEPGGTTDEGRAGGISQLIVPVKVATPDADGKVFHVVEAGQSFWAIAIAYKITIKDIETWNNISSQSKLQIGQRLFIPTSNTKGYYTPTPVGMILVSTPDQDGKIIHAVQPYQNLTSIAQAYGTSVEAILSLNGIQADWPLQIGQALLVHPGFVTPSPTPRPLTPIEKLTPAADGKYYHTVGSGESLSWIADLYEIAVNDLIAWNGLSVASVIQPNDRLLLQVTPPPTETPTPGPATATPSATRALPTLSATPLPTFTAAPPTATVAPPRAANRTTLIWGILVGMASVGLFLILYFSRKRP